jgi:hypothetical protein
MRKFVTVLALLGACSAAAFAAQTAPAKPAKAGAASTAAKSAATHSTSGVVKSVDNSTLVITHGSKDMTFTVNGSTQKDGSVATGSHVTVRYQGEGKSMVATAITAQPAKAAAPAKKK